MKRVVPMHDDLFDFFYEALPGYEEVGRRRVLLGCWGSLNDPEHCDFTLPEHDRLGPQDVRHPRRGRRRQAGHQRPGRHQPRHPDPARPLVLRGLGRPGDVRHPGPAGQPGRPAAPVEPAHDPAGRRSATSTTSTAGPCPRAGSTARTTWPLDTGGGPIARLWATALAGLVDCGYVQSTGHSVKINLPRTMTRPESHLRVEDPGGQAGQPLSNAIERDRARTYFQAYAAGLRAVLRRAGAGRDPGRADQDLGAVQRAGRGVQLRLHRGGARRAVAPHGDPGRQDRELPPVPAHAVERQRPRRLRDAGAVRGRGAEHADLRGEPAGELQGHRHHARRAQLRPVPAVRGAHVPGRRQGAQDRRTRRWASPSPCSDRPLRSA